MSGGGITLLGSSVVLQYTERRGEGRRDYFTGKLSCIMSVAPVIMLLNKKYQ